MKYNGLLVVLVGVVCLALAGCGRDESSLKSVSSLVDPFTDEKTAPVNLQTKAKQGDAIAQCRLGVAYSTGEGVPQDYKEAAKWYRLAAEQGNANAQALLGSCYSLGQGVPQDSKEAVKWYRLSAEQGLAQAQALLGVVYSAGEGVPQDYTEAVKWYSKGRGVPQDSKEAVKWFRLAAEQGLAGAQSNLGVLLFVKEKAGRQNC